MFGLLKDAPIVCKAGAMIQRSADEVFDSVGADRFVCGSVTHGLVDLYSLRFVAYRWNTRGEKQ